MANLLFYLGIILLSSAAFIHSLIAGLGVSGIILIFLAILKSMDETLARKRKNLGH